MTVGWRASRAIRRLPMAAMMLFAIALLPTSGFAQTQVQLALTGGPVSFGAPTASDLTAGGLEAPAPLTYEVQTSQEPPLGTHTTTVYIRNSSSTLGGGKPVADLEWRRGDEATWHALTTTDALVESRTQGFAELGHSWSNTIHFRIALGWTSDPPATYTGNLVVTVSTTQP
jgi:hypothetical protein